MRHVSVLFCLLLTTSAWGYQEVVIKAVSNTEKSFVIALGKEDGIVETTEATFAVNDVSVVARAETVTRTYSHWKLLNATIAVPFARNQIVTMNNAVEHVWTIMPEHMRRDLIEKHIPKKQHSLIGRTTFVKGMTQSTSGVDNINPQRGGFALDLVYEWPLNKTLALGGGFRVAQESIDAGYATLVSTRYIALAELTMYLPPIQEAFDAQFYLSGVLGIGRSITAVENYAQTGTARILPGARVGINLPIVQNEYDFQTEVGFESINVSESLPEGGLQTSDQTDARLTFAIRKYL